MAYEISNYSVKVTLVAGADLSALQYNFVKINSSGQAVACAAATGTLLAGGSPKLAIVARRPLPAGDAAGLSNENRGGTRGHWRHRSRGPRR